MDGGGAGQRAGIDNGHGTVAGLKATDEVTGECPGWEQ